MKVIKSDSGFLVLQKILKHIHSNNSKIVVWQLLPNGKRHVLDSTLSSLNFESGLLHFQLDDNSSLNGMLPAYFYAEDGQFIFKTTIQDIRTKVFTVNVPAEIQLLEDPDINVIRGSIGLDLSDIWKTKKLDVDLDDGPELARVKSLKQRSTRDLELLEDQFSKQNSDEDEEYVEKRASPRGKPTSDKWVRIMTGTSDEIHLLKLFDLSRGGLSFVTMEPKIFPVGEPIRIAGFEDDFLDDPLPALIVSQRPTDDSGIEYKIGCQFLEKP